MHNLMKNKLLVDGEKVGDVAKKDEAQSDSEENGSPPPQKKVRYHRTHHRQVMV